MTATGVPTVLLFRLRHDGALLEAEVEPAGHRARVRLRRDGELVGERTGAGRVRVPLPGAEGAAGPARTAVLVRVLPRGEPLDAVLEVPGVPRPARTPFEPPPGTTAARWHAWQRRHPALWASRHVLLAAGRVALGLLGVLVLLQPLVRWVLAWLREHLPDLDLPRISWPDLDLPRIPWPDWDLPGIPWPDWDLPDLHAPWWLATLIATAKFWVPVLIALVVAVREVRRRRAGGRDTGGEAPGGAAPTAQHRQARGRQDEHGRDDHEEPGAHR
ncbi:hypothetical protein [Kineococcus auxinigenes]|uniref:hypothetical protein n=1 Tax=unclassified Kineococcus TaxID=2621656 RepID=UPI003D7E93A2